MRIQIFAHDANPAVDAPFMRKSRSYAKGLLAQMKARVVDGKSADETLAIQLYAQLQTWETSVVREAQVLGLLRSQRMTNTALNRGRAGQFSLGYDVPYVHEGHLTSPQSPTFAAKVNAGDAAHEPVTPTLAQHGFDLDGKHYLNGKLRSAGRPIEIHLIPSTYQNFYHVAVLQDDAVGGGAQLDTTEKPVRKDGVLVTLRSMGVSNQDLRSATWTHSEHASRENPFADVAQ